MLLYDFDEKGLITQPTYLPIGTNPSKIFSTKLQLCIRASKCSFWVKTQKQSLAKIMQFFMGKTSKGKKKKQQFIKNNPGANFLSLERAGGGPGDSEGFLLRDLRGRR